ncbi:dipeptide epimerase [Cytophaga hutchinsonii]|uniref:D-Ala-D/L-Ala epimerase n=1 Tax=Cytophaga hutchinsonii (strain ATCC 33406 / DSM 1761 / CIP 103989 / NBRC 15051 / NCIMB 9469 / D465) TaxID=269798 RepID=AAEP_CYTH3|nr:dipeptide epimerase [Cytophaga hutchinsonii]Q11T61.1 RecName: Full=D-Ala-D/L-Ala epimerase [Cytophaga hutchinsonii ATCC 33406]3Q45_A Chain A, Mandelate racemase/muconate lactonizing enzyme family; possible chloromuconate cycloisomerase [Cytophaga hutchinsonii ATCC 33406]3Q45_B Chain B, Mandelate racemase/muconate lactonizing enzyme family; possible chloromuconate cycloisomerase [Cytophaga hutchinsonii ATCC 33406]3Q45_C Chain C, Mandelate racemase/muconate lactonizing enzyme family; possible 
MIITQVELYKSPVKLKEPFKISLGILTHANNVIVRIHTASGHIGYGECSPFMTIHGESMDTAFIVGQYLAKGLIGTSCLDIVSNSLLMDAIIYGNSCIKSAFNIALYDLAAQHAGLPLYAFLGGKKDKIIQTDYTVSIDEPHKMAADAVQIKKNGFEIIKVKVGGSKELDVERIRMIREAAGDSITLRIDANQGWSVETAIETLTLLEPYNIQHCEEPVSRNLYTALPKIRQACRIPIMADESCCNSFDAERLIQIQACDSFNLKLSKSAGITNALNIIRLAEQAHMPVQVGGFLESRLGFTAAAHVALVSKTICYYDFDTPLMFEADPVRGGIVYQQRGIIEVPETAGLGAGYQKDYLSGLEKICIN